MTKALPTQDYSAQLNALKSQNASGVNRVFSALKDKAEIKDNDLFFDYKLRNGICKNKSATFIMKKYQVI